MAKQGTLKMFTWRTLGVRGRKRLHMTCAGHSKKEATAQARKLIKKHLRGPGYDEVRKAWLEQLEETEPDVEAAKDHYVLNCPSP